MYLLAVALLRDTGPGNEGCVGEEGVWVWARDRERERERDGREREKGA